MTGGVLSSPGSGDVRSIATFLIVLVPGVLLLAMTNGSGLADFARRHDGADAGRPVADIAPRDVAPSWDRLREYPFARRDDFTAGMRRLVHQLAERHSGAAGKTPSATFRESLGRMQAELESLRLASDRTWGNAKQEVGEAWRQLEQAATAPN